MNREIVYPGAIPQDTDMLSAYLQAMISDGFIMRAAFSNFASGVLCDGLACTPATPTANQTVVVAPGVIMALETVDSTAYGSLGTNSAPLVKMGINLTSTTVNLASLIGALTGSQFMNCLIQVQFNEADGTPIVLPYYNATNPSSPYSGPGNTGVAQNTVRAETVSIGVIAGTTNSLAVPSPTTGWSGLYSVYIFAGQTQILSTNITQIGSAPFIGTKIGQLRQKMSGNTSFYVSTATGASDSNSGLSTNSPFATLQGAWNSIISNWDLNGYGVTINVAAGTYTAITTFGGQPTGYGANSFVLVTGAGSSTILTSTGIGAAISVSGGAVALVAACTINGAYGLQAFSGSQISVGGTVTFGACSGAHLLANGGAIILPSNYTISGSAAAHYSTENSGFIATAGASAVTLSGTPAFTNFAQAFSGQINVPGLTFSGSATGARYSSTGGGLINTGGAGTSYFPGSSAGSTGSGTNTGFYA
jgi:hypothetical protein